MKDSERLDLLKEIGGTRVYEDRRKESLKIMTETGSLKLWITSILYISYQISKWHVEMTILLLRAANKRKQIDQVVHYLEERLRELDEEKEELKKYQQLDKQKRSLEYTILDHELNDARNELASVRLYHFCYACLHFWKLFLFCLTSWNNLTQKQRRPRDWVWWTNHYVTISWVVSYPDGKTLIFQRA